MKKILIIFILVSLFFVANLSYASIDKTLRYGMNDIQVKALQELLNSKGYIISESGLGSKGNESTYFGNKTVEAVKKFQLASGLTSDGVFGSKSLAKLLNLNQINEDHLIINTNISSVKKNEVSSNVLKEDLDKLNNCNSKIQFIIGYEETSPDFLDKNINNKEQDVARFILYSPCDISISGISGLPYGAYSENNMNYTFFGSNRFSQFSAYKGYGNNKKVLGTSSYAGAGGSSTVVNINFSEPLKLNAGIPQVLTIGGKLKPENEVSGTFLERGQFCIMGPINLKDLNGNTKSIEGSFGNDGLLDRNGKIISYNFIGKNTCGDIFSIINGPLD